MFSPELSTNKQRTQSQVSDANLAGNDPPQLSGMKRKLSSDIQGGINVNIQVNHVNVSHNVSHVNNHLNVTAEHPEKKIRFDQNINAHSGDPNDPNAPRKISTSDNSTGEISNKSNKQLNLSINSNNTTNSMNSTTAPDNTSFTSLNTSANHGNNGSLNYYVVLLWRSHGTQKSYYDVL
jgi:hypothetical protein